MRSSRNYVFKSEAINVFCQKHALSLPGQYYGIAEILLALLDNEGDISSLTKKTSRWMVKHKTAEYEELSKISLLQHSLDVAAIITELVDSALILHPLAIIAALAHDLGKIPRLFDPSLTEFNRRIHAYSSEKFISQLVNGRLTTNEAAAVAEAIRFHHEPALGGPLVNLLKRADALAREREGVPKKYRNDLSAFERPRTIKFNLEDYRLHQESLGEKSARIPDPSAVHIPWFDLDEFIIRLTPCINDPMTGGLKAISSKEGVCYFEPYFLFEVLKKIALEKQWLEILQIEADKDRHKDAIAHIIHKFRERDLICEALLPSSFFFYWRFFVYINKMPMEKCMYTPIKKEAFAIPNERLEKKKLGRLLWIYAIKPDRRGKNNG